MGPPAADGSRTVVFVAAYDLLEGDSCAESRAGVTTPELPDEVTAVRCVGDLVMPLWAKGLSVATVERLAAGITETAPTRLDTTGTDLASVGIGPADSRFATVSYVHPSRPGLELQTFAERRFDRVALLRSSRGLRDVVDVDVAGRPGFQYNGGRYRPGGLDVTVLVWSPEPGLTATITVEGPSDELVAIALDVVVRPGDEVHREGDVAPS